MEQAIDKRSCRGARLGQELRLLVQAGWQYCQQWVNLPMAYGDAGPFDRQQGLNVSRGEIDEITGREEHLISGSLPEYGSHPKQWVVLFFRLLNDWKSQ